MKIMSKHTDNTVFEHIKETVDSMTGEVTLTEKKSIVKQAKTPEFIMMFTEGAPFLANAKLTGAQTSVLFMLLHKFVLPKDNVILLTSYTRQTISQEIGIAKNTVDSAILTLIDKAIILVKKEMGKVYYLNPNLFGRGNWNNIKKLRYQTLVDYDFENKNIDITNATTFAYDDVDKDNITITVAEENISEDGKHKEQKIYIEDKSKNEIDMGDYSIVTVNPVSKNEELEKIRDNEQEKNIIAYEDYKTKQEIELIKQRKELLQEENESKRLSLEEKKIELEILKLKNKDVSKQGSLFDETNY